VTEYRRIYAVKVTFHYSFTLQFSFPALINNNI